MLTKERPHLPRRVDTAAIWPDQPFRHYRLAVWPLMASSLDCVEHHACVVSAVRVLEARDIRSDGDSIGFGPHRFRRDQFAIKLGTLGNVSSPSFDRPLLYGQTGSAIP